MAIFCAQGIEGRNDIFYPIRQKLFIDLNAKQK